MLRSLPRARCASGPSGSPGSLCVPARSGGLGLQVRALGCVCACSVACEAGTDECVVCDRCRALACAMPDRGSAPSWLTP